MVKKTKKATKPSRLHHEVKHTDWKFVTILVVLAIIGLGVFRIYQGLKAQNPEIYRVRSGPRPSGVVGTINRTLNREKKADKRQKKSDEEGFLPDDYNGDLYLGCVANKPCN